MSKTWFIAGAARGFGLPWAEGALGYGDKVTASVNNPESLADLLNGYGCIHSPSDAALQKT
jgi:NAD(P)-dependent dehydrogenase (short-subunit alcohol dehydrogenase family)